MKESYNTRFFQFFLALVITIVVSEIVLTHVSNKAYAKESSDSQFSAVEPNSELSQAALESAFGSPKEMPATTVAMKAAIASETTKIENVSIRTARQISPSLVRDAVESAKAANEELKAEDAAASDVEQADEVPATYEPRVPEQNNQEYTENSWQTENQNQPSYEEPAEEPQPAGLTQTQEPAEEETPEEPAPVQEEPAQDEETTTEETNTQEEPTTEEQQPQEESTQEDTSSSSYGTCLGSFRITAYCPCTYCCGPNACGITASGVPAVANHTIAADTSVLPFGTVVYIEGIGTYVVEDRGVYGNAIDIYFDTHQQACNFGLAYANVYIVG